MAKTFGRWYYADDFTDTILACGLSLTPLLDCFSQAFKNRLCCGEVDAGVGDALAVNIVAILLIVLAACDQMTLQHDAGDTSFTSGNLLCEHFGHFTLASAVLVAVAVAAVDDDVGRQIKLRKLLKDWPDRPALIVGTRAVAPAKDDVRVLVACRLEDCSDALFCHRWEPVWLIGRADRVDRHLYIPTGSVLEADWHR